jgi:hypothetical protein
MVAHFFICAFSLKLVNFGSSSRRLAAFAFSSPRRSVISSSRRPAHTRMRQFGKHGAVAQRLAPSRLNLTTLVQDYIPGEAKNLER